MNKTELLDKADELIKKSDELIAKANELKEFANKEEIILVPDKIKITESMMWYSMWIINWDQELYYSYRCKDWVVNAPFDEEAIIKCKLVPCKYEDLKPWDLFYRSNLKDSDFGHLYQYALKLDDWSYQFWVGKGCCNIATHWDYYWKVQEI